MFEAIERVPGDAILGLIQAFKHDPNPDKVDLGVGVYRDEDGSTPIMRAVKAAEQRLVDTEATKAYIGSHGDPDYGRHVLETLLGTDSAVLADNRASATQSPGGTGALRLAADFIKSNLPGKSIWLSDPTWPNHKGVFGAAGLDMQSYPYVDADNRLDFDGMLAALKQIPVGGEPIAVQLALDPILRGAWDERETFDRFADAGIAEASVDLVALDEAELNALHATFAAQREARWGSKFEATLAEFRALSANGTCARLVQERWAMTKSLPFDVLSRSQQENCNPWSSGPAVAHRTGDLKGEGSNATKASKLAVSNARAARKEKQQRRRRESSSSEHHASSDEHADAKDVAPPIKRSELSITALNFSKNFLY